MGVTTPKLPCTPPPLPPVRSTLWPLWKRVSEFVHGGCRGDCGAESRTQVWPSVLHRLIAQQRPDTAAAPVTRLTTGWGRAVTPQSRRLGPPARPAFEAPWDAGTSLARRGASAHASSRARIHGPRSRHEGPRSRGGDRTLRSPRSSRRGSPRGAGGAGRSRRRPLPLPPPCVFGCTTAPSEPSSRESLSRAGRLASPRAHQRTRYPQAHRPRPARDQSGTGLGEGSPSACAVSSPTAPRRERACGSAWRSAR